jgi:spermidine synthase
MGISLSRRWFFLLFTISGAAGLVYESIWSHYLKLFLGHAAYAQTLVLAIFMGGMALGAWLCSRGSAKWRNLLLLYAAVEAVTGLLAIVFHPVFVMATDFAYDTVMPGLGNAVSVSVFKWTLAALLLVPQSVLLGMTFPLMSAGVIRLYPDRSGGTIAMLYFTNSLGAAIGVLASGFYLIGSVGLPGTVLAAGIVNIVLALVVWLIARRSPAPFAAPVVAQALRAPSSGRKYQLMLAVSLLTGCASFMYEIGWIRMLSMVLSSSTHAFELMLSAFILGLAFGGLWIKRRIDRYDSPESVLGVIQIAMGVLALGTLVVYGSSFELMQVLMHSVARTGPGYALFNAGSHAIALLVMFPAAFCAGMTLPLITHVLLRSGAGERAIGAVYAANTVGAIVGVMIAIHVAMPMLGLKGLIIAGAAIDIALGAVLLGRLNAANRYFARGAIAAGVVAVALTLAMVQLDTLKMASGVYRDGRLMAPGQAEILFHRDGKTATVNLVRAGGRLSITTNGKSDAMVNLAPGAEASDDDPVMVLLGALPVLLHPNARNAAVIGMGSGISSHVLLASESLRQLDTIEIEPAMVAAASGFRPRNAAVFDDPRSRIHIEDAKTFFSTRRMRYDVIVSEPSNPWVSGVAGLFSEEFYRHIRGHLAPDGLFVQWLQLYEMAPALVASVMKALAGQFSHYEIYVPDEGNLIIVARDGMAVPPPSDAAFRQPDLAAELERLQIAGVADLDVFRLGPKKALQPYFDRFAMPTNSDYFPVLDQNAAESRFLAISASDIVRLGTTPIPVLDFLGGPPRLAVPAAPRRWLRRSQLAHEARQGLSYLLDGRLQALNGLPEVLRANIQLVRLVALECAAPGTPVSVEQLFGLADALLPYLGAGESRALWDRLRASPCLPAGRGLESWLTLFAAIDGRAAETMARTAETLLLHADVPHRDYLLGAAITGRLSLGENAVASRLWSEYAGSVLSGRTNVLPDLLLGHLLARADR